jgi:predicted nucleotidyltransferase
MAPKPRTAVGYGSGQVAHVRATCLYVATKLGDLLDDIVIVGGLVPSLIIDQNTALLRHVGTADLDVGLALAVLNEKRYQVLTERLRQAGFGPDTNERGNPTSQRWIVDGPPRVAVDFLIAPTDEQELGGQVKNIEPDFAAIIAPGLRLAFEDRLRVTLDGQTIRGERARRDLWVCGPGAFVAMKALALRSRGENKDAYDLAYVLQNQEGGTDVVAKRIAPLLALPEAVEAMRRLDEDFATIDSIGPRRVAEFLFDARNEVAEADAWGAARDLVERVNKMGVRS